MASRQSRKAVNHGIGVEMKLLLAAITLALGGLTPVGSWAGTFQTIATFHVKNGSTPVAGLVFDKDGNLYGATEVGGQNGFGVVFKLTPPAKGKAAWTPTTLFTFDANTAYGVNPVANLVIDKTGNIYGTTLHSGSGNNGTVFELTPPAKGKTAWTPSTLYNFSGTSGASYAGVVFDKSGSLFGALSQGGPSDLGLVYELSPAAKGKKGWTPSTLLTFNGTNGGSPYDDLVLDAAGNLYGTTNSGGASSNGTVFKLTSPAKGSTVWTPSTLASFNASNGANPVSSVVFDKAGNLYGTTLNGGTYGQGTVFELMAPAKEKAPWTLTTLLNFYGANGGSPYGSLVFDKAGNLYGTTSQGGSGGDGTVFELTPPAKAKGAWTPVTLVNFNGVNGSSPNSGLVLSKDGSLFGTTSQGGPTGDGTVFMIGP
jgi:uncharacterized repeat protein (TIGR03803 family)